jgi:ABC-type Fe3+/spermidine/putrescine transport system ATPase subunit
LMDEPLGALDRKLKEELQIEIKRVQRVTGVTVLYVTHDQDEALILSDRIAIMDHGRLHQVGTPREVYERPNSTFVARFMGESNSLEGIVGSSSDDRVIISLPFDGVTVECRAAALRSGGKVQVILRPEALRLLPASGGSSQPNLAAGHIEEMVYLGQSIRYLVRVGPTLLAVRVAHRPGKEVISCGDAVVVAFPKQAPALPI